jgi:hypothetical protein
MVSKLKRQPTEKEKNLCLLYIWQGINNQNLQRAQKSELPWHKWPNEEIGKWTEQKLFKGRSSNG